MAFGGDIVRLAGIETVNYTKDGKEGSFTRLHFVYPENKVSGVQGCKVEQVFCPREVDYTRLTLGAAYQQKIEIRGGKNGNSAILVGLNRVDEGG